MGDSTDKTESYRTAFEPTSVTRLPEKRIGDADRPLSPESDPPVETETNVTRTPHDTEVGEVGDQPFSSDSDRPRETE